MSAHSNLLAAAQILRKVDAIYAQRDEARFAIRAALAVLEPDHPAAAVLRTVDLEAKS